MTTPAPSHLSESFAGASKKPAPRPHPPVLSIRLTTEERAKLEREAAGRTLSAHARKRLFGDDAVSRRGSAKSPVKDHVALARVLSALGHSPQVGTLKGVLRASEDGAVVLATEAEAALLTACARIEAMRADLIAALGLKSG